MDSQPDKPDLPPKEHQPSQPAGSTTTGTPSLQPTGAGPGAVVAGVPGALDPDLSQATDSNNNEQRIAQAQRIFEEALRQVASLYRIPSARHKGLNTLCERFAKDAHRVFYPATPKRPIEYGPGAQDDGIAAMVCLRPGEEDGGDPMRGEEDEPEPSSSHPSSEKASSSELRNVVESREPIQSSKPSEQETRLPTPSHSSPEPDAQVSPNSETRHRKPKKVLKKDIKMCISHDQATFAQSLQTLGMESMMAGGMRIRWVDICKRAVDLAIERYDKDEEKYRSKVQHQLNMQADNQGGPELEPRAEQDIQEQLDSKMDEWRSSNPRITTEQAWQIMFNLIAYVFFPAQAQAPEIVRSMVKVSRAQSTAAESSRQEQTTTNESNDITAIVEDYVRKEATGSSCPATGDEVGSRVEDLLLEVEKHDRRLKEISLRIKHEMRCSGPKTALTKFYQHYNQIENCNTYHSLLQLYKTQPHILDFILRTRGIEPRFGPGLGTETNLLIYICHENYGDNGTDDKSHTRRKQVSTQMSYAFPVVRIRKYFGLGVVALLGDNIRDLASRLPGEDDEDKSKPGRNEGSGSKKVQKRGKKINHIRDLASRLPGEDDEDKSKPGRNEGSGTRKVQMRCKKINHIARHLLIVDKQEYGGRLSAMLDDVKELIYQPAMDLRTDGKKPGPWVRCPSKEDLDKLDLGAELDYTLRMLKAGAAGNTEDSDAETPERRGKRSCPSVASSSAETGSGKPKRPKTHHEQVDPPEQEARGIHLDSDDGDTWSGRGKRRLRSRRGNEITPSDRDEPSRDSRESLRFADSLGSSDGSGDEENNNGGEGTSRSDSGDDSDGDDESDGGDGSE